jgi:putative acetyltransferase
MIREYKNKDIERILDIWFLASLQAHDFIKSSFWKSQINNMRNVYIPSCDMINVYERKSDILGFYAISKNTLAALFVAPQFQAQGIGKALMLHAKSQKKYLELTVYKENKASCEFYHKQGFQVVSEQVDPHTRHLELLMRFS